MCLKGNTPRRVLIPAFAPALVRTAKKSGNRCHLCNCSVLGGQYTPPRSHPCACIGPSCCRVVAPSCCHAVVLLWWCAGERRVFCGRERCRGHLRRRPGVGLSEAHGRLLGENPTASSLARCTVNASNKHELCYQGFRRKCTFASCV